MFDYDQDENNFLGHRAQQKLFKTNNESRSLYKSFLVARFDLPTLNTINKPNSHYFQFVGKQRKYDDITHPTKYQKFISLECFFFFNILVQAALTFDLHKRKQ